MVKLRDLLITTSTLFLLSPLGKLFSFDRTKDLMVEDTKTKTTIQIVEKSDKQKKSFQSFDNKYIKYTVQKGATLSGISAAFGLPYNKVFEFNKKNNPYFYDVFPTENPNLMLANTILYIPLEDEESKKSDLEYKIINLNKEVKFLQETINEKEKDLNLKFENIRKKMISAYSPPIKTNVNETKEGSSGKGFFLDMTATYNPSNKIEKDVSLSMGYKLNEYFSFLFKNGTGPTHRTEFSYQNKTQNLFKKIPNISMNLILDLNVGFHKAYFEKGMSVNKIHNAYGSVGLGTEISLPFNTIFRYTKDFGSHKDIFLKENNQKRWSSVKGLGKSFYFETGIFPLPLSFSYEDALLNHAKEYETEVSFSPLLGNFGKFEPWIGYGRVEQELRGRNLTSNRILFGLKLNN